MNSKKVHYFPFYVRLSHFSYQFVFFRLSLHIPCDNAESTIHAGISISLTRTRYIRRKYLRKQSTFQTKKIYDKHSTVRKTKQNKLKFMHTDFAGSLRNVLLCHTVIVVSHKHIPYCCHSRSCSDNMHSRKRSFCRN